MQLPYNKAIIRMDNILPKKIIFKVKEVIFQVKMSLLNKWLLFTLKSYYIHIINLFRTISYPCFIINYCKKILCEIIYTPFVFFYL